MPAIDSAQDLLICPVCQLILTHDDRLLGCSHGHRFDLARQGYVNLLSRSAGANADSSDMIHARDRFLGAGHYQPIQQAIAETCADAASIAEVGVGTGYYLDAAVATARPDRHLGIDISVAAAKRTARRNLACAVADTWQGLPISDDCLDRILCIFAPRNPTEFGRVLSSHGQVIVLTPASHHLIELRRQYGLLNLEENKLSRLDDSFDMAGLRLIERREIRFAVDLDQQAAHDLIAMGPNAFHQSEIAVPESIVTQAHVTLSIFESAKS